MSNSFENMTSDEQKMWWLEQAKKSLVEFGMCNADVIWLAHTHNAVFQVIDGETQYVLKIATQDNIHQLANEYALLNLLSSENLPVAQPIEQSSSDNSFAILVSHLSGKSASGDTVTPEQMKQIGVFLANFHNVSFSNANFTLRKLDWHGLFSSSGIYHPGDENMKVFTDEQMSVMGAVAEKVKIAMDELGQDEDEFGIIHGDFLLKNILFHKDQIYALDFEYCGWGYYLYDLTPLLWQLKPQDRYAQLEQALWDGYTSIRSLSGKHRDLLETFIAGRQVASMRWIAANQQNPYVTGKVEIILAQRTAELSQFLETGIFKRV